MKRLTLAIVVIGVGMMLAGCPPVSKPDLIVTSLAKTGDAVINLDNSVEVPIRVVVKNQGGSSAAVFKVSVEYTSTQGTFVVAFTVPGQASIWYPYTSGPLGPGANVTFEGKLTFHPSVHEETVDIVAIADSCSGDEFMPEYCRVDESDETNNASSAISVPLP